MSIIQRLFQSGSSITIITRLNFILMACSCYAVYNNYYPLPLSIPPPLSLSSSLLPAHTHHTVVYETLGGAYIGSGEENQRKPTLFVVSCVEGHLDLRTAEEVLQTLQAEESGQSGLPSPATIISDKNYIMVWDIN